MLADVADAGNTGTPASLADTSATLARCRWTLGLNLDSDDGPKGDEIDSVVLAEVATGIRETSDTRFASAFASCVVVVVVELDLCPSAVSCPPCSCPPPVGCTSAPAAAVPSSGDVIQLLEDRRTGHGGAAAGLGVGNAPRCDSRTSSISV